MLESPTGTGKTVSLLCAVLGWQENQRKRTTVVPKIYFTSRTHTQISQAIQQLKNTEYLPKIAVLGSRDQGCVNPAL